MKNVKDNDNVSNFYHVYNRGVDKQPIFKDDLDRVRFIKNLIFFKSREDASLEILAYCLMDNHYHFLIEEKVDKAVARLMHRIGIGYTLYFNKKYKRSGCIFESGYKCKLISSDGYLFHIFRYIHLNPLKLFNSTWKNGVSDIEKAIIFVRSYKWSNLKDVFKSNSFVNHNLLESEFRDFTDYQRFLEDWIRFGVPKLNSLI